MGRCTVRRDAWRTAWRPSLAAALLALSLAACLASWPGQAAAADPAVRHGSIELESAAFAPQGVPSGVASQQPASAQAPDDHERSIRQREALALALGAAVLLLAIHILVRGRKERQDEKRRHLLEVRVAERTAELTEANRQLREMGKNMRAVLEALQESAFLMEPDGRVLLSNRTGAARLGLSAEDILGRNVFDLFPPRVAAQRRAKVDEMLTARRPLRFEDERFGRRYDISIQPVLDDQGRVARLAFFAYDVTEARAAEERLRASEEFSRAILHSLRAQLAILDSSGTIIQTNRSWRAFASDSGLSGPEVGPGTDYLRVCENACSPHAEEAAKAARGIREVIAGEADEFVVEYSCHAPDGARLWMNMRVGRLEGGDGRVVVSHEDITNVKQAAADLADTEARYRSFFESTTDGLLMASPDGTIFEANPAATQILGWSAEEFRRIGREGMVDPSDPAADTFRSEREQNGWAAGEMRLRRKDGGTITAEVSSSLYTDSAGRVRACSVFRDVSGRKLAERRLMELSEFNERIISESPLGIVAFREDGQCIQANQAAASILGGTIKAMLAMNFREIPSWRDSGLLDTADEVLQSGIQAEVSLQIVTSFGRRVWLECGLGTFESGGQRHLLQIINDVTERQETAEALRREKESARLYFDVAAITLLVLDTEGRIRRINRQGCALFGFDDETGLLGRDAFSFMPESLRAGVRENFDRFVTGASGPAEHLEVPVVGARGGERMVAWNSTLLYDEQGRVSGVLASGEDVTESRRLRQEQEMFFTVSLDLVCIGTMDGYLRQVSPAWTETLGWSAEELTGRPYIEFVHPEDRESSRDMGMHLRDGRSAIDFENRFARKDGTWRWLSWKAVADRETGLVFAIARDVTEAKAAEAELREARAQAEAATRAKSEFLANMSHEIRTPMNAILGLTMLAKRTQLSARQRGYLEKIGTSASSLLTIINDILDFSKIEAGRLEFERTAFGLDEVLAQLSDTLAYKAEEKGLELFLAPAADVPRFLVGDPVRLGQVLLNLAGNAVKFTEHGEVVVSVSVADRWKDGVRLRFSVRDSGIGMTPEEQMRLFRPFTQADGSTTRRYGGTGLGLSICRRLVEMMGGSIRVESVPGEGSTFAFSAEFGLPAGQPAGPATPAGDLRGLHVLVVDDSTTARDILADMLHSMGYTSRLAASGAQALDALRAASQEGRPFDLVLMDRRMPDMDGLEASRRMREDETLAHPPTVVMVTAHDRDELLQAAGEERPDAVLQKPVSASSLHDVIMEVFGRMPGGDEAAEGARRIEAHARGARVLLVEDNEINREVAIEILHNAGLRVDTAADGREAVERLAADPSGYAAVLMDVQMPVMDGYEATAAIREDLGLASLPIIAMTAHAMASERRRCLRAGMNDHVPKPVDPDRLVGVLNRWLGGPDKPDLLRRAPAPPQAREGSAALPEVPGVDMREALRHSSRSRDLTVKLLLSFAERYEDAANTLRSLIAQGDPSTARRFAHSLKGASGTLAAGEVFALAERADKLLAEGKGAEAEELLPGLAAALATVCAGIRAAFTASPEEACVQGAVRLLDAGHAARLEPALAELDAQLARNSLGARRSFEDFADAVGADQCGDLFQEIRENLSRLDFKTARIMLRGLAEKLGIPVREAAQ
ncbi:PAS/PAC sensor hybrid histidine kinase [Desulfovibrio sp. X2]|uniref:PAS domain-containing hybrid sensor histidine kinase/response regulator n=1 Tax=Desulfovibrio sp. X2 TaxID=941449 RepID=UPI0003587640|nr:PAS domain S-box protein [Desulfovibrio sp. X2]EPR41073.1 PAS/PAC sensor hybrid histidine kinase [Desulfovibrio sp. X2]